MKKIIVGILMGMSLLVGFVGSDGKVSAADTYVQKVTCPKGTLVGDGKVKRDVYTMADCNVAEDDKKLMPVINTIINVIVGMVGIVAVAMMVIGGITMATSQGDTSKVSKGKNTMIYGIVGLVVAILAFAIVNFVLKGVFGS